MSVAMLLRAAEFAARKHRAQRRKSGDQAPYINHPVHVAYILAEIGGVEDIAVLAAALLHDTLEDTETTPQELEASFGPEVRRLVEEVTDDKQLPSAERKRLQIEAAGALSRGAALIRLADKISNVGDLSQSPPANWSPERLRAYVAWAEAVIAACPKVHAGLEARFAEVVAATRRSAQ